MVPFLSTPFPHVTSPFKQSAAPRRFFPHHLRLAQTVPYLHSLKATRPSKRLRKKRARATFSPWSVLTEGGGGLIGAVTMTTYWRCDLSRPLAELFTYDLGAGGWGNDEAQEYTDSPENAFVRLDGDGDGDGVLVVRACARPDGKVTSARLISRQTLERPRGYVSARITVPLAPGIWPAFWALPKKPFSWPYDGEVDIVETWNALEHNGTSFHNGHYDGKDWDKHRVLKTPTANMDRKPGHWYGFAWEGDSEGARLLWFTDGCPTMRATVPAGTRSMRDFQVIMNIAVGGNVQPGKLPPFPSEHDLEIQDLAMTDEPPGGWGKPFDDAWAAAKDGNTM